MFKPQLKSFMTHFCINPTKNVGTWLCLLVLTSQSFAQSSEPVAIQARPWCKLSEITIHQRSANQWKVSKVTYDWNGLYATVSGGDTIAVEYNKWGYIKRRLWNSSNFNRLFLDEKEWDCSLGWCRPANFRWNGLEGEGSIRLSDIKVSYNELGYPLEYYTRFSPDFYRDSYQYDCGELFCKLTETIEEAWCNQCGGWSETIHTRYQWSGRLAQLSIVQSDEGSRGERTVLKGHGSILISETGQTLMKQVSYTNGDAKKEQYHYICHDGT